MPQENPTFSHDFSHRLSGQFDIALFEPDIPLNTGSVARTCACTGSPLHIVGPAGFRLDDRLARRAGLDYWELAEVHIHRTWEEFREIMGGRRMWLFSTKGTKGYWNVEYLPGDVLVFGSETSGLPARILDSGAGEILRIPMEKDMRSLNLSNAVAIALYEALRQTGPQ